LGFIIKRHGEGSAQENRKAAKDQNSIYLERN